jgi:hypothetical protein
MVVELVGAGFEPAFNHQNNFLFEFEGGLEARAYELNPMYTPHARS